MQFKNFIITAIMIGVFIFAMIFFASNLAIDNSADVKLTDNPPIKSAYESLNSTLKETRETAEGQKNSTELEVPTAGDSVLLFSITKVISVFRGVVTGIYNITFVLLASTLGIPVFFLNIMFGVLVMIGVLAAWRLYRVGY